MTINETPCGHVSNNSRRISGFCPDHAGGIAPVLLVVHPVHDRHESLSACGVVLSYSSTFPRPHFLSSLVLYSWMSLVTKWSKLGGHTVTVRQNLRLQCVDTSQYSENVPHQLQSVPSLSPKHSNKHRIYL